MIVQKRSNTVPIIAGMLIIITILSGLVLISDSSYADDTVDEINITVPMSCTMSGTGQDSHNANINNGTYTPNIGTTTMHVFCNDNAGFSIYAAGYTGDEIGGTNSNKLVGTSASDNAAIESGLATSAGNPDVSNWAMKLTITQDSGDTTGTNAFVIDSAPNVSLPSEAESGATSASFSDYHVVPNEYVKVAHKISSTDMTANTGGTKIASTYAAYISKTQKADTYTGQVIYTLVHPANADTPIHPDQIGVNFYGNGLTFAGGETSNHVIYGNGCITDEYIAIVPEIVETSNLTNGIQDGSYTDSELIFQTKTFTGANKIKVVVDYAVTADTAGIGIIEGTWNGDWNNPPETYYKIQPFNNESSTEEYILNGDTATIYINSYRAAQSGYDYGFYTRLYPIYAAEHENTGIMSTTCGLIAQNGTYAQTTTWYNKWFFNDNGRITFLEDESAIIDYVEQNENTLFGTTIDLYAYNYSCNPNATNISQVRCMQDFASFTNESRASVLNSMNRGTQYVLRDSRDDKFYTITKLADGNIWMTQNLDLDLDSTKTYTNEDTDIGYDAATKQYSTASWIPHNSTYSATVDHVGNWNSSFTYPVSYDPGNLYWNGAESDKNNWLNYMESCYHSNNVLICDQSINPTPDYTTTTGIPQYHIGNYYNWPAATAASNAETSWEWRLVDQSICPAGWTLPLPGEGEDTFYSLWQRYNFLQYPYELDGNSQRLNSGGALWKNPFYLVPSGYYSAFTPINIGSDGWYWTKATYGEIGANANYSISDSSSHPSSILYRSDGGSIRCVARPVINSAINLPSVVFDTT
ncbi:hypothetical protein IKG49_02795 [Candidatus Saccharibacteria bacterium]|nr:hypothetical protein [Candidatus Saccharibacteria bacterium]